MKKILLSLALVSLLSPVAFANDNEKTAETTVDTSTNPITGTVKTTKKTHPKLKGKHGQATLDTKEVTKKMKDGTVEKKVEVDGSSTNH